MKKPGQDDLERQNAQLRKERDHLRRLLVERTERLHLKSFALDLVREAAYLIGENGRVAYVNEASCRALGYSADELLQMTVMDIDPSWSFDRSTDLLAKLRSIGSHVFESTHRRRDGSLFPVEINISYFEYGGSAYKLALVRDITEHRKVEEQLYASEQAFRAVVEHSPDYIVRYDLNYRRVYVNPARLKLIERTASEMLGTTPVEPSSLLDPSTYRERLQTVVATGKEFAEEVQFRNAAGETRWGHMRIVPEFAPDGQVSSLLVIGRDIHELKRSEQLFRTLTENLPDFIVRFDSECRPSYVNPAVAKAFAMTQEDFVGKRVRELELEPVSEPAQNDLLEAGIRRVFEEGQPNEHEARWQLADHERCYEIRHVPEKDSEGRVVSVLGIGRDITRLRSAELALRASERAYRTLAENAPDPIIRYDRNCNRIYVNPEYERVTGHKAEHVLGRSPAQISFGPAHLIAPFTEKLAGIMDSGIPEEMDYTYEANGKTVWWYVRAVPEYDEHGAIQSVLTIWRNVTEHKEAERRLLESYELLRELASRRETAREEERRRIAREMHDELGQHLTALRMGVSALRLQFGHEHPALAERIQNILSLSDQTIQVVRDVVSSLRPSVLDAGIAAALEWLTAEFSRTNGQITCRLRVIEADLVLSEELAVALFRIVQEALTNITRHARARQVVITLKRRGDDCVLEVCDDGRGFDPVAIRKKSFGLAGMKERVLMLGGKIGIASTRGAGTAVKVSIPIAKRGANA
ncbi:PAS domain S-box protein [Paraburkholderia sp.]|uniref:sensor histidine kinase n=1 Tax=Paraburkholderia sp. TaxID=1926495 RepID=UPI00257B6C21|nr:PAS domain S-box protein [Paraburkholderia sp.]